MQVMTTEPENLPEPTSRRRAFSSWMAALARVSVGLFALMALYTLVFDVSALNWNWNYAMWTIMGVSIVAAFLAMATEWR